MERSSDNGQEPRRSLEDIFKDGFEGAESAPSAKLWENVDRELENLELKRYRKQVFWYRSVAAACLLLLLAIGGFFYKNSGLEPRQFASGPNFFQTKPADPSTEGPEQEPRLGQDSPLAKNNLPSNNISTAADTEDAPVFGQVSKKQVKNGNSASRRMEAFQLPRLAIHRKNDTPVQNPETLSGSKLSGWDAEGGNQASVALAEPQESTKRTKTTAIAPDQPSNVKNTPEQGTHSLAASAENNLKDSTAQESLLSTQKPEKALATVEEGPLKDAKPEESRFSKWSWGLAYAPQYAFSPIRLNQFNTMPSVANGIAAASQQNKQYQAALSEYNQTYQPAYSYQATVGAQYQLSAKWFVEAGIQYAKNVGTTQHTYLISSNPMATAWADQESRATPIPLMSQSMPNMMSAGDFTVTATSPYTTQYNYEQIGAPVRIGFRQELGQFYAFASGGLRLNLLLKNTIEPGNSQLEAQHYSLTDTHSPFRKYQVSSLSAVGIGYHLASGVSVAVSPEVGYALTPFLKDNRYQSNNFQMGISFETKWRFAK